MTSFCYGGNIQANGIRQHYLRYGGRGQPLLLIPGITSPAITWGFVAEELARTHDVYVLDVRGRGLSESGPELAYDFDSYALDASAFIEAMSLEDCIIVGHSMGARIAARLTRLSSIKIAKIVLVDPPVSGPGRREYPSKIDWYVNSIRHSLRGMTGEEMRPYLPTWTEEQLRLRAEWLHTCSEQAVVETYERMHTEDFHPDVPHLSAPTLLLVATRAGVILPEDEAELVKLSTKIVVRRIDAGHMIPWDNLKDFLAAVTPFIGGRD